MAEKKYYWLKLKRDFFKRHDIRIIEEMPNGKEYILFYLKLLLESIDHEGALRFSETVPYNEQMLSVITNTNIDIVRSAMKMFIELKMMDIYDDQTIYMAEVDKLIGSETEWARKKRLYREQQLALGDGTIGGQKRTLSDKSKSIEIEKDKETEKEKKASPQKRFVPPSLEEVQAYCSERGNGIDAQAFIDFYASKGWLVGKTKMSDWKAAVRTWESRNRKQNKPTYSTIDYGNPEDIF
jgi:predicted phage replisome organizer